MEACFYSRDLASAEIGSKGVVNAHWQGQKWGTFGVLDHNWQGRKWGTFGGVNPHSRRGSALLVVLGMLAFMLFSGLAFSVYMRQSRLPTSFLRRTVATRQLAKAALAEAIEEIDMAIGNDPHPGVLASNTRRNCIGNAWEHRVFVGYSEATTTCDYANELDLAEDSANNQDSGQVDLSKRTYLADPSDTVSTLTLEGLAYLPPNLINEVRYYSQRTATAKWHSFWFDSGRYAYTAVDVSDYFDVNRIYANHPRASGASKRISFAHLFEDVEYNKGAFDHSGIGSGSDKWDEFMDEYRQVDEKGKETSNMPFVSLADFNIAWGSQPIGGLKCPFYYFVKDGTPYDCGTAENDAEAEKYRGMTFVTDGWFPVSSSGSKTTTCDLADPRYQPFKMDKLENESLRPSIDDVAQQMSYSSSDALTVYQPLLNEPNFAALWDYLDVDSVPVSLCIPTVERVPMICGIRPWMDGDVKLTVKQDKDDDVAGSAQQKLDSSGDLWDFYSREVTYTLDISALVSAQKGVNVLLTYPFQEHGMTENLGRNFTIDGRLAVFLTMDDGGETISIRPKNFAAYPKKDTISKAEITDQSVLSFPIRSTGVTPKSIINGSSKKEMPCIDQGLVVDSATPQGSLVLAKVKYSWPRDKWTVDAEGNKVGPVKVNADPVLEGDASSLGYANTKIDSVSDVKFLLLKSDGSQYKDSDLVGILKDRSKSVKLKANVAVWVRVKDDKDNTVDFVPACESDDVNMNKGQTSRCTEACGGGSSGYPLMRSVATEVGDSMAYSLKNLNGGTLGTVTMPETKWIVSDPRYNHAPENWVLAGSGDVATGDLKPEDWTNNDKILVQIQNGDGDVFMSTSDECYLQSIYELSFLPRVANGFSAKSKGNSSMGNLDYKKFSTMTDYPTTFAAAKDTSGSDGNQVMWRTYSPYGDSDDFSELEDLFVSSGGQKVNPYSDSTHVLMAAFANTPHDWRVASTNNPDIWEESGDPVLKATQFNKKYAWNGYSSDETGKLCWGCLSELAEKFQDKVREQTYAGNWEDAFANLGWSDAGVAADVRKMRLAGVELDDDGPLYSVDKKFLYGFWHDCFASRQQLFLIFVRAEPMMMGGGVSGQVPPQLGARAVALVWRDPTETEKRSNDDDSSGVTRYNPHRTRILFYHQFD